MSNPLHMFRILVGIGIVANLAFAIPAFFAPSILDSLIEIPQIIETLWLRNVGILLIIITSTYIPVILDPIRYIIVTVIIVVGRFSAGVFFALAYLFGDYPSGVAVMSGLDLGLSGLQAYFLVQFLRQGDPLTEPE